MFDEELINALCEQLRMESDPQKIREIADTLRAIVETNVDDLRLRMDFLTQSTRDSPLSSDLHHIEGHGRGVARR